MRIRNLILAAMFAALIYIAITFFRVPNPVGGIIHFGDAFIFLAAVVLPFPYAMFAAGIGAGLSNALSGFIMWMPFTIIIKPLMTLCFTSKQTKIFVGPRNYIAPLFAGMINLVLYYLATVFLIGFGFMGDGPTGVALWLTPMGGVLGDVIQFGGSAAIFFVLAKAIDRLDLKMRLLDT